MSEHPPELVETVAQAMVAPTAWTPLHPDAKREFQRQARAALDAITETHAEQWSDKHSAKRAAVGVVLHDEDDDLFTVKAGDNRWVVYMRAGWTLSDFDIDRDRGDQIVGHLSTASEAPD